MSKPRINDNIYETEHGNYEMELMHHKMFARGRCSSFQAKT